MIKRKLNKNSELQVYIKSTKWIEIKKEFSIIHAKSLNGDTSLKNLLNKLKVPS
jgi:hypothetical protein